MAPTPATIQIDFTSNYGPGTHRVCYRIQGDPNPSYTCINVACTPFVPPGSQACQALIPITVDNESCAEVTYEGYIQPTCEDISSAAGRIPFEVTFVPSPSCTAVEFTCNNVEIIDAAISNAGTGYTPGVGYTVAAADFIGGGGAGTTITFDVDGGGQVTNVAVTVNGSGWTSAPIINITTASGAGGNDDAIIVPRMGTCPIVNLTTTCDNPDAGTTAKAVLGDSFQVCYTGGVGSAPVPASNWVVGEDPSTCCYDCVSLEIAIVGGSTVLGVSYIDCATGASTLINMTPGDPPVNVCAKRNSWVRGGSAITFTEGPLCTP